MRMRFEHANSPSAASMTGHPSRATIEESPAALIYRNDGAGRAITFDTGQRCDDTNIESAVVAISAKTIPTVKDVLRRFDQKRRSARLWNANWANDVYRFRHLGGLYETLCDHNLYQYQRRSIRMRRESISVTGQRMAM